jgi:aspartyl-tRNA(Asn)/glutamyl-tRNA(Gln) amidotransferase subunit B
VPGPAYETVIGLEIHVQLRTRTKMFCGCAAEFGAPPNTRVCPVCLGLPGALPVVNGRAVELAVLTALALNCEVHRRSFFARKNYFYPDLPKGYQITQYDRPLATGGWLEFPADGRVRRVRIRRLHLEEDAGKLLHDRFPGLTAVDLNRAGVPLVEIVTEPDLRSPAEARAFLGRLKQTLEYLDVSDCNMEEGSLRVDANVSVRAADGGRRSAQTEVKNMNSFSQLEKALEFEAARHVAVLESGGAIERETVLWDPVRNEARPMRSKEEEHDYRYFREPDLPPLEVGAAVVTRLRARLPELPGPKVERFMAEYGLPAYDAEVLCATRALADYYEAVARLTRDPKQASNWVMGEVLALCNELDVAVDGLGLEPERLAGLIEAVAAGELPRGLGRRVLRRMVETGKTAAEVIEEEGLRQVSDAGRIEAWVAEVLEEHPAEAERYREGEEKLLAFFMGQVMRKSRGRADPGRLREALLAALARLN